MIFRKQSRSSGGALIWYAQRITGLVLVLVLLAHFFVNHFVASDGKVSYESTAARFADPFWKTLELTFLFLALFHGLNGVWMVAEDYLHDRPWARVACFTLLVLSGLVILSLGAITVISFKPAL